jgi:hypothetical protein
MRVVLLACTFFAGVYCGLNAEPDGELVQVIQQISDLVGGYED